MKPPDFFVLRLLASTPVASVCHVPVPTAKKKLYYLPLPSTFNLMGSCESFEVSKADAMRLGASSQRVRVMTGEPSRKVFPSMK